MMLSVVQKQNAVIKSINSDELLSATVLKSRQNQWLNRELRSCRRIVEAISQATPRVHYAVDSTLTMYWWLGWRISNLYERWCPDRPFTEFDIIPDEIWLSVFQLLDCNDDITNLRGACRRFRRIGSDFTLKRKFMLQKIPFDQRREGNDLPINAIVIGDRKIGKTNFISRFLTDSDTKRKGFGTRYFTRPGHRGNVGISLWDVADASSPSRNVLQFAMLCDVVCVCFSVHSKKSFEACGEWLEKAYVEIGERRAQLGHQRLAPLVLVGLIDPSEKTRHISQHDANALRRQLAKKHNVPAMYRDATSIASINETWKESLVLISKAANEELRAKLKPFLH